MNGYWKNWQQFPHIPDFFHLKKTGSCSSRDILSLLGYTQMHILKYIYPINTGEEQSLEEKEELNPFLWTSNPARKEEVLLLKNLQHFLTILY